jgi:hypothetical protein
MTYVRAGSAFVGMLLQGFQGPAFLNWFEMNAPASVEPGVNSLELSVTSIMF